MLGRRVQFENDAREALVTRDANLDDLGSVHRGHPQGERKRSDDVAPFPGTDAAVLLTDHDASSATRIRSAG